MDIPHPGLRVAPGRKLHEMKLFFGNSSKEPHLKQRRYQRLSLIGLVANCFQYKASVFNPFNLKAIKHDCASVSRRGNFYRFINFSLQSAAAITGY